MSENSRTALITGASRGLGLALAKRLAEDGWNLLIDGRNPEALDAATAELSELTTVAAITGDVSDKAHRDALAEAVRNSGGLDLLVNNASILGPSPRPELIEYPLDALEEVYRVNVFAPLALVQAVKGSLNPEAAIVNITSDAAVQNYEGWGGYGSSKAALEQISNILAAEMPHLRIYALDPGDMRTRMHEEAFPGEDISDRPLPEASVPEIMRVIESDLPSGRYEVRNLPGDSRGIRELRVAVTADDFEAARVFYEEGLGLPVVDEWAREDGSGVIFSAPTTTVEILDRRQSEFVDEVEAKGRASSGHVRLAVEARDVVEAAAALRKAGAKMVGQSAVETPWGDENMRLETPDGLQITLFRPVEEKEAVR
ncbi:MAG: SDR family NAD(P)-dependent oxidoreductase [Rubrobacter sp.]|nr:SDR family NAD(P)-dependent oxidoreductase [Rubrobacter sp.]